MPVIIPDVNLLIYAFDQKSRFHAQAKPWLETALSGAEQVGFAWTVLLGFVRISTRNLLAPLTPEQALNLVRLWTSQPNASILDPGKQHVEVLSRLLLGAGTAGNLTSDAHLAALALEHDGEIYSVDTDFGRFPGVRWRNPLQPE